MQHSNIFGTSRVKESKLKMKASDKEINFNEFGSACEGACLTRGINPKTVEESTLKGVDFSECETLTELCEKALRELVQDGADSDLAELAVAGFVMWWGRTYNGVTPIVNFINLLFMVMREDVADIIRKRQYDGLIPGFRVDDVMLDFEKALSNIIFEGKLEKSVSDIKASLISDLKRELARHNDHQLTYVLNNAIDRL